MKEKVGEVEEVSDVSTPPWRFRSVETQDERSHREAVARILAGGGRPFRPVAPETGSRIGTPREGSGESHSRQCPFPQPVQFKVLRAVSHPPRPLRPQRPLRSFFHWLWLCCIVLLCAITPARAQTVAQIAARVDAHYDSLRSLESGFSETYSGAGITRNESGTLWLKRPGRMRWEYLEPRKKLFVTDGKTAWFYVPGEKQARKAPVRKLADLRSPLAYLLGHTKLEKEFAGLSLAPDVKPEVSSNLVLRGIPRHATGITQVLMEVAPDGRFVRIEIAGEDGSTTQFHFSDQRENVPVSDQSFHFSPPPGVETIEADLGSN
jgi:outer membrane lipoprotein carrier protein